MVRKRFLSSSSGAWSISSGVKRVLSWGRGGVRLECGTGGGEGLRSRSILLLFLLFCCMSSSRRLTVVRPTTRRKSSFWGRGEEAKRRDAVRAHRQRRPRKGVQRGTYLCGVVQFKRGLLCYSPEVSSHLLFITLIVRVVQLIVVTYGNKVTLNICGLK